MRSAELGRLKVNSAVTIEPSPSVQARKPGAPVRRRHDHCCHTCAVTYECLGPEETGYCAPVCQPCYWIELGSQLRVYKEIVAEMERKRAAIERCIGTSACRAAASRRPKLTNDATVLVAFGNLFTPTGSARLLPLSNKDDFPGQQLSTFQEEAHGGSTHGE